MIRILDALAITIIIGVAFCAGISIVVRSMESKVPVCLSYSQGAVSHVIDGLLPHPGRADPVYGDAQ